MVILAGAAVGAVLVFVGYILGYNQGVRHTEARWTEAVARTNRAGW